MSSRNPTSGAQKPNDVFYTEKEKSVESIERRCAPAEVPMHFSTGVGTADRV